MSTEDARDALIARLLDLSDAESATRPGFAPAIPREQAARLIEDALALYECRQGSSASIYAAVRLSDRLGFKPVSGS